MASTEQRDKIDENKRLRFLEWFSNAKFEPSKESSNRFVCCDPGLQIMTYQLLKDVYKMGYKYSAWKTQDNFHLTNPSGRADIVVLSGTPRLIRSNETLLPGTIKTISNDDILTPPMNCIYIYDAERTWNSAPTAESKE